MKLARAAFALVFAVVILGLPAMAAAQGATAVSGTLTYRERITLPATAIVTIQIAQVVATGTPQVIAEQRLTTNGAQPPYRYSLPYDAARVDPNGSYTLQANIAVAGQTYFRTTQLYPVITRGNPTQNVNVLLVSAGRLPNTGDGATPLLIAAVTGLAALAAFATRRLLPGDERP